VKIPPPMRPIKDTGDDPDIKKAHDIGCRFLKQKRRTRKAARLAAIVEIDCS